MVSKHYDFQFVEKKLRQKTFGVLTTIDGKGRPHSTGILYGVSPPDSDFAIFFATHEKYAKVRNIRKNPKVSFVVTFPHYYLRFAPDSYLMLRGEAEILPFDNRDGQWAFHQKRMLKMNLKMPPEIMQDAVFIKMKPGPTVFCFGVGYGILDIARHHEDVMYKVRIPEERLRPQS